MTPHGVKIVGNDGNVATTFPSEGVIRLSQSTERVGTLSVDTGNHDCPRCDVELEMLHDGHIGYRPECPECGWVATQKVPLSRTSFGGAEQLPPKKEDTIYIVSSMVCQACPDRPDFYIPNETVRDDEGRIIGCRSLSRNPFYAGSEEEVVQ